MSKNIVLTFYDAVINHLSFAVPLLQEYGFGATFFVRRNAKWIAEHPECYPGWQEMFIRHLDILRDPSYRVMGMKDGIVSMIYICKQPKPAMG